MERDGEHYQQYLAGDDEGLVAIIRQYQHGLTLYLNTYVGNLHVAEELAEDTFVKLATKKPAFRGKSAFGTWLFAIGRRVALDHLRRHRRKAPLSTEDYGDLLPATADDPADTVQKQEEAARLRRALYRLPPAYRQALWLIYYEQYSHERVAAVMGRSVHAVDTLVYRARQALKTILEQEEITYEIP
ncbi:MAG: RNA polymerase sigma factor [Clostridia bacterium]|nr:RNA polymerase sigma factor [Clostridia bacterium]